MKGIFLLCLAGSVSVPGLTRGAELPYAITGAGAAVNVAGAGHSLQPTITPDGRFVVFLSHANNLIANDGLHPGLDVFVRDRQSLVTTLMSVSISGTGGGNRDSGYPSISPDGRFVVFSSDAHNLVANDTNEASDVFLRDVATGATLLVSVNTNGGVSPSMFGSTRPIMSPNVRWVVFESSAEDLVEGDTNGIRDLFIRDTHTSVTRVVSIGAERALPGRSHSPSITDDGRRVAFISDAANLIAGRTNRYGDVYVRDLQTSQTFWASSNLVAYFNNGTNEFRCSNPVITSDRRYVAFKAALKHDTPAHVFYHDLETGTTKALATNSHSYTAPALTGDGRWLAFEENDAIYLRDLENETNLLVSINATGSGPANGKSLRPVLTPNGAHVAFISSATDLEATPLSTTNIFRVYIRDLLAGVARLVGVATNGLASEFDMEEVLPALSADGRLVAFDTDASDIVPDDNNHSYDVFVRDLATGSTGLVSVRHTARPARTGFQSAGISRLSVTADAQRIAFTSYDDDRVPQDTNRMIDTFVFDRLTSELLPQSTSNGLFAPWVNAVQPSISASGQHLLFLRENRSGYFQGGSTFDIIWRSVDGTAEFQLRTNADFLGIFPVPLSAALSSDGRFVACSFNNRLHLRDMIAGTNRVLSNAGSESNPQFSPDDQWVVFNRSLALEAAHTQSNRTVSIGQLWTPSSRPAFSGTGRFLGFESTPGRQILRFDLQSMNSTLVCASCGEPSLNHDGNLVAILSFQAGARNDIYVVNMTNGSMTLISRDYTGNGGGNRDSSSPLISGDGRYVVYVSKASNLVLNDANNAADIFVHDRVQGATMLVTRNRHGTGSGNALSSTPVLSRDGRTVVFQSFAGDLVEGDYNERRDIFLLKLGVGDLDNDGMDDDWEVAHFNDLNRDGAGDFDGDGQTDRQEFVSGTDPTNNGSVLRVLTVSPMGGGSTTVIWAAVPNRNYVVQFKDSLSASNWSNASGILTATSHSESFLHPSGAARRYYRVIAVQ